MTVKGKAWRERLLRSRVSVRVAPADMSTPQGREKERYRLAGLAIIANFASATLGALAFLVTVPLTISYLGEERFGVWMTIASFASLLSFLDLGIGNGLLNRVAHANAAGDPARLRGTVTRGLLLLAGIGCVVGLVLIPAAQFLPIDRIVKVHSVPVKEELQATFLTFAVLFSMSILLNGIPRVFAGLQRAWLAHAVRGGGSLLSLILVIALAQEKAGPQALLLATYGVQVLTPLVLLAYLLQKKLVGRASKHEPPEAARSDISALTRLGGLFLVLQIGTLVGWGSDALILSSVLGAAEVAKYSIVQRLFQFISVPLAILNGPLWSAYADASARGDRTFIVTTLRRSMLTTAALATAASAVFYWVSDSILTHWLGESVSVPRALIAWYAIWNILEATGNAFAMFLNGMGVIRPQVILVLGFCLLALPLKFLLPPILGVAGIVAATVLVYAITVVGCYALVFRMEISRSVSRSS